VLATSGVAVLAAVVSAGLGERAASVLPPDGDPVGQTFAWVAYPDAWVEPWADQSVTWMALDAPLPGARDAEYRVLAAPAASLPRVPRDVTVEASRTVAGVRDERWRRADARPARERTAAKAPVGDLIDALPRTRVEVVSTDGTARPCSPMSFGRMRCGAHPWEFVGVVSVPVRGRNERCVWAHPIEGASLRFTMPVGSDGGTVTGRAGFADSALGPGRSGKATLAVKAGEAAIASVERDRVQGFATFRAELPAEARELVFEVSSEAVGAAHFCFDAQVRASRRP
jgi:hypothetical protein